VRDGARRDRECAGREQPGVLHALVLGQDKVEDGADPDRAEPAGECGVDPPEPEQPTQQQHDRRPAQQQHAERERHRPPAELLPLREGQHGADQQEDRQDEVAVERLVDRGLLLSVPLANRRVVEQPGDEDGEHLGGVQQAGDPEHGQCQEQGQDEFGGLVHLVRLVLLVQPARPPTGGVADQRPDAHSQDDLVDRPADLTTGSLVQHRHQRHQHQRQREAVVEAGLLGEDLPQPLRQRLLRWRAGDHAGGKDRVGRAQAGTEQCRERNRQAEQERAERAGHQGGKRHDQQHEQDGGPDHRAQLSYRESQGDADQRDGQQRPRRLQQECGAHLVRDHEQTQRGGAERRAEAQGDQRLGDRQPADPLAAEDECHGEQTRHGIGQVQRLHAPGLLSIVLGDTSAGAAVGASGIPGVRTDDARRARPSVRPAWPEGTPTGPAADLLLRQQQAYAGVLGLTSRTQRMRAGEVGLRGGAVGPISP